MVNSFIQNVIPKANIIEKYFERNTLASQLLWYFNSGLHRFSNIDYLPDDNVVKSLVDEIKAEVPSFIENQSIVDDYIKFYNKKMISLHVLAVE